jgi:hypothetical protein
MTPKEKAIERVLAYYSIISSIDLSLLKKLPEPPFINGWYDKAKQCAIAEVEQTILATNSNPYFIGVREELNLLP